MAIVFKVTRSSAFIKRILRLTFIPASVRFQEWFIVLRVRSLGERQASDKSVGIT